MFITITNAEKGKPFRLAESIDNTNKNLEIGIKKISGRVGLYNVENELEWRYTHQGGSPSNPITIKPGLYNFALLAKKFTSQIDGLEIELNRKTGKIEMTVPAEYQIWLPDEIRNMFGLDEDGWLDDGVYDGDRSTELMPQRILVYLKQLSTTDNLQSSKETLSGSQLLGWIPLSNEAFGKYYAIHYEKPSFKKLQNGTLHELDFDFKVDYRNQTKKLDNHDQPLDLEIEIR